MRLPIAERSYAVLIGTSNHRSKELIDLPAVSNNISALTAILTHPSFGSLQSDRCISTENPEGVRNVYRTLRRCAQLADDTLVVYFAGHGRVGLRNELYLTLSDTDVEELPVSALPLDLLRDVLAESRALNRVLVLDCCFSGRAIPDLGVTEEAVIAQLDVEGTYTLTATSGNSVALAPVGAKHTAFTGELINLLESGIKGGPELLTFTTLFPRLLHAMNSRNLPTPRQRGIGTADRLALARNPAYVRPSATPPLAAQRRGDPARLPENLQLLLSDEPVLDVYSFGPWRVPDGLYEEIRERGVTINNDERTKLLTRELSEFYGPHVTVAGAELWSLLTFLLGASALRGGSRGDVDYEILGSFLATPEAPVRDQFAWFTQGGRWRPPGLWLPGTAGNDPELREIMYGLARDCLDTFAGIEPIEQRRLTLIGIFERRRALPELHELDLNSRQGLIEDLWMKDLDDGVLTILPELGGAVSYLEWSCAGFAAAHERLLDAVNSGDNLNVALARLLLQANTNTTQQPAELAICLGNARYQAISEHIEFLRKDFVLEKWQQEIRAWLAHCLVTGEAEACRVWVDMAVRITGAVQGLPSTAASPRCGVPVRLFQTDLYRLFSSRKITNMVAARFTTGDESAKRRRSHE